MFHGGDSEIVQRFFFSNKQVSIEISIYYYCQWDFTGKEFTAIQSENNAIENSQRQDDFLRPKGMTL